MKKIPIYQPYLNGNESKYVKDCMESNWISSKGEYVSKFEKSVENYIGNVSATSCSNGTVALHLALLALNIRPGDEVITTPFSFFSTVETILLLKAKPVFVDIDEFYHMDIREMEAFDTSLKAILFVDLYGQTPDIDKINEFAKTFNIKVIEDAAQSFGAEYKGKKVGSLVDLTCFSFNPVKNLGAMGDAGAVTGSKELVDKVKMYRDHGRKTKFEYDAVGYNSRIDNLQAVVVQAKLSKIDDWLDKKRAICRRYTDKLKNIVKCPQEAPWGLHSYYVYVIETPAGTRDKLAEFLKTKGIATNVHYRNPTHTTKAFKKYAVESLPITENICNNILSLPCYHTLPKHWQDYIVAGIKEFYDKH